MTELFTDLFDWMAALPVLWAYAAVLLIAYGENVLPPIPGDLVIVFGGYMAGIGKLDFVPVVLLATLGGALGFMTMFGLGYRLGGAVLDPERMTWVPLKHARKAQAWLRRWGLGVVVANRFLSGARSVIALTAGMARMRVWRIALASTVSAAVWTTLLVWAGYKLGSNWGVVADYLQEYGRVVIGLMVIGAGIWGVRWWRRSRRRSEVNAARTAAASSTIGTRPSVSPGPEAPADPEAPSAEESA